MFYISQLKLIHILKMLLEFAFLAFLANCIFVCFQKLFGQKHKSFINRYCFELHNMLVAVLGHKDSFKHFSKVSYFQLVNQLIKVHIYVYLSNRAKEVCISKPL